MFHLPGTHLYVRKTLQNAHISKFVLIVEQKMLHLHRFVLDVVKNLKNNFFK